MLFYLFDISMVSESISQGCLTFLKSMFENNFELNVDLSFVEI